MGIPKTSPAIALPSQVTPDLVGLLLSHHRDRIEFCRIGEVTDLSEEFSQRYGCHITEREIIKAMGEAWLYLEEE